MKRAGSRSTAQPHPTPASLGLRMPAEWAPHAATWLAWPHNRSDWPGRFTPIPWVYGEMIRNLTRAEAVHLIVADRAEERRARAVLAKSGAAMERVHFHRWATNRVWTRDYGPIFVVARVRGGDKGGPSLVNFTFNAWAKYPDWQADNQIPSRVAKLLGARQFQATIGGRPFVLEGGSIDVNGLGTLLTTEECLLSDVQQRNPGASRDGIELALHNFLGISQVIWLERGIAGDDTHGHVDDIARFVAADVVAAAVEPNKNDPNHAILAENLQRLKQARDHNGKPITVIELPLPKPVIFAGQRLPASYANFYIANETVLVPVFNDANDRHALNTLAEAFRSRQVIPIYCGDFIWGLGAIHCATQQQPA